MASLKLPLFCVKIWSLNILKSFSDSPPLPHYLFSLGGNRKIKFILNPQILQPSIQSFYFFTNNAEYIRIREYIRKRKIWLLFVNRNKKLSNFVQVFYGIDFFAMRRKAYKINTENVFFLSFLRIFCKKSEESYGR